MIDINTTVCQSKEIDSTDLDGETVMMNLNKGKYFALNLVGSHIWDILKEEICVRDVIKILLEEYDVDREMCENSVINYLELLKNEELITIK